MLLSHQGVDFEDKRLSGESWMEFKPKTPFGQMPTLEMDGKMYAQTGAIMRFLGAKYGYYKAGDYEQDCAIDNFEDFFGAKMPRDTEGRPKLYALFGESAMSKEDADSLAAARLASFSNLEKVLGDKKFFGGDKVGIADFLIYASMSGL